MKVKNLILGGVAALSVLTSCNDSFMEREPVGVLGESNAFQTYDNFKAYMYNCYGMFTDGTIHTNFSGGTYYYGGQYASDFYAGIMTNRDNSRNPYAYGTLTQTTSSSNWSFSYPRVVNIMLSHLDDSQLTETEKKHWRSVGYFFHAFWYMELVARYGDVPWINKPLTDESPEAYGPRTPRAEVADSIVARLEYAAANIGDCSRDGDNPVTANAVKAALSRFLLREGTWAKYHENDKTRSDKYLKRCLEVSQELMNAYPTLHKGNGFNKYPGAGYDEVMTSEDLSKVAGVIMYKQYLDPLVRHRFSDLVHVEAHRCDAPQHTVDMFLMANGKPINNPTSGFQGGEGKDLYDYFAERDPRLYINICPPAVTKLGGSSTPDNVTTFKKWSFYKAGEQYKGEFEITPEYEEKFRRYIDYLGPNVFCENGTGDESLGSKRLPGHNWGGSMSSTSPNISHWSQIENYMRCWTGYYFWKHYTAWEVGSNGNYQTSDKPIFTIEEVLLNYAEAYYEYNGTFGQTQADVTINLLRERAGVAKMTVSEITADFDPNRDKGTAAWTKAYDAKTNYEVSPILWEIRRERMVELFGQGFAFYDVKRWHKAPYYVNRQPCGAWVTATNLPYGKGTYSGDFVDYNAIQRDGKAVALDKSVGQGWIYTYEAPLSVGTGWNDIFYLEMVPQNQRNLNPELTQNPGYNEYFGLE